MRQIRSTREMKTIMCAEVFSAFVNGARAEKVFVETAEAFGVPETYCSYHKVLMGGALSGVLPQPLFIVNTSLACDANNLTFRALAEHYRIPQFYVDVPSRRDEESVRYVADQLRELTAFLEQQTGRKLDGTALRETIERSRRTIENFRACMLLTPFNSDSTDAKTVAFVKAYQEKYGEVPNQFAADAYDCVYAYKQALEAAGCTPDMSASDICSKMIEQFTSMGLAPILVEQIFDIINNLHKAGSTILLVEQNAQMALSVANRGYVLETGKIVTTGTGSELLASPAIKKAYLGG